MTQKVEEKKDGDTVLEQWTLCNFDDDLAVESGSESKSKWIRLYLVLTDSGILSLFGDETKGSAKGSFDLRLWTNDQIIENTKKTEIGTFKMSMITDEGTIRFAFESEEERSKTMECIKRFVGGQGTERMLYFGECLEIINELRTEDVSITQKCN